MQDGQICVACIMAPYPDSMLDMMRVRDFAMNGMIVTVVSSYEDWRFKLTEETAIDVIVIFMEGTPPENLRPQSRYGYLTGLLIAGQIHQTLPSHSPMVVMGPGATLTSLNAEIRTLAEQAGNPRIIAAGPDDITVIRQLAETSRTNGTQQRLISDAEMQSFVEQLESGDFSGLN